MSAGLPGGAPAQTQLLDAGSVVAHLRARRLLGISEQAAVEELDGGISNVVLAVTTASSSWVVKQSLLELRVATPWRAKQERILNEARGLRAAALITPDHVPGVVDVDPQRFVLVIERAPATLTQWKRRLMKGVVDAGVGATLGNVLGTWHAVSAGDPALLADLDDPEAFEQLRVSPYHRTAAAALPRCAPALGAVVNRMASRRVCLVHGDFSPKNVLTGEGGTWVLDFEVAHRGDPDFDVAFLLTHLLMKAVHRPQDRDALRATARAFTDAYDRVTGREPWRGVPEHLLEHVGALLVSRSDGASPAEYLTNDGRAVVRELGRRLLTLPPARPDAAWTLLDEMDVP